MAPSPGPPKEAQALAPALATLRCARCTDRLPADQFAEDPSSATGRSHICRDCASSQSIEQATPRQLDRFRERLRKLSEADRNNVDLVQLTVEMAKNFGGIKSFAKWYVEMTKKAFETDRLKIALDASREFMRLIRQTEQLRADDKDPSQMSDDELIAELRIYVGNLSRQMSGPTLDV